MDNFTGPPKYKPICPRNQWLSLPSAWDWSSSQVENMDRILYNLNLLIRFVDDFEADYKGYTDQEISALKEELENQISSLDTTLRLLISTEIEKAKTEVYNQVTAEYTAAIQELGTSLQRQINTINNTLTQFQNYVNIQLGDIRRKHAQDISRLENQIAVTKKACMDYTDSQITQVRAYIDDEISKIKVYVDEVNEDGFRIYNPITATKEKVEKTVNDVYNYLRVHAITAGAWDAWYKNYHHTTKEFLRFRMNAREFDINAGHVMWHREHHQINSPIFSGRVPIFRAVDGAWSYNNELLFHIDELDALSLKIPGMYTDEKYRISAKDWDTKNAKMFDDSNVTTLGRSDNGWRRLVKFVGAWGKVESMDAPYSLVTTWLMNPFTLHTLDIESKAFFFQFSNPENKSIWDWEDLQYDQTPVRLNKVITTIKVQSTAENTTKIIGAYASFIIRDLPNGPVDMPINPQKLVTAGQRDAAHIDGDEYESTYRWLAQYWDSLREIYH